MILLKTFDWAPLSLTRIGVQDNKKSKMQMFRSVFQSFGRVQWEAQIYDTVTLIPCIKVEINTSFRWVDLCICNNCQISTTDAYGTYWLVGCMRNV